MAFPVSMPPQAMDGETGMLPAMAHDDLETENIEARLLLDAIYQKYGYDFRDYAWASIKRRLLHRYRLGGFETLAAMQHRLLRDPEFFKTLLGDLTISVTEMFRDPSFYKALRDLVLPVLARQPFLRIWHAGCSSGEEVYSMAILLKEEGLAERVQIYATDMSESVLQRARDGIYPIGRMRQFTVNYQKGGGRESFSDYYTASYDSVIIDKSLRSRIVFANHNLVTDGVFGEMQMVVCRNVLIYFNNSLRNRVLGIFRQSLEDGGFLCLGTKESVMFSDVSGAFEEFSRTERIYRKKDVEQQDGGRA